MNGFVNTSHSQQRIPWFEAQRERLEIDRLLRKHGLLPPLRAIELSLDKQGKIVRKLVEV